MNYRSILPLLSLTAFAFTSCVTLDENGNIPRSDKPAPGTATQLPDRTPVREYGQPLTASTSQGAVTVREGNRVVTSFRSAAPNVEETRWYSEQEQIVVKSRGSHGPATVQLFNSRTGRELGRVMAYGIKGGQPAWAAGMGE